MAVATKTKPKTAAEAPAASPPEPGRTSERLGLTGDAKDYVDQLQDNTNRLIEAAAEFVFSASIADEATMAWRKPHKFPLTATAPGATAMVKAVDLNTPETLLGLQTPLLQRVVQIQETIQPLQARLKATEGDMPIDMAAAKESYGLLAELHAIYVVAGFVQPPVIASEDDRTSPDQVLVEFIHPSDRAHFFDWCQEKNGRVNATLTRFPGEPVRKLEAG